ncbi:hypothetical protein CSUI_007456 [Cystoisospora suis]|uniref:Uncharacterized protein n=1 Tax=Cystoisospora suis TaxID=483139 RepID=A0A2C6KQU8_9APIC|nr:hypothetical protein CSUI_007456 [Cystoisospora suis]
MSITRYKGLILEVVDEIRRLRVVEKTRKSECAHLLSEINTLKAELRAKQLEIDSCASVAVPGSSALAEKQVRVLSKEVEELKEVLSPTEMQKERLEVKRKQAEMEKELDLLRIAEADTRGHASELAVHTAQLKTELETCRSFGSSLREPQLWKALGAGDRKRRKTDTDLTVPGQQLGVHAFRAGLHRFQMNTQDGLKSHQAETESSENTIEENTEASDAALARPPAVAQKTPRLQNTRAVEGVKDCRSPEKTQRGPSPDHEVSDAVTERPKQQSAKDFTTLGVPSRALPVYDSFARVGTDCTDVADSVTTAVLPADETAASAFSSSLTPAGLAALPECVVAPRIGEQNTPLVTGLAAKAEVPPAEKFPESLVADKNTEMTHQTGLGPLSSCSRDDTDSEATASGIRLELQQDGTRSFSTKSDADGGVSAEPDDTGRNLNHALPLALRPRGTAVLPGISPERKRNKNLQSGTECSDDSKGWLENEHGGNSPRTTPELSTKASAGVCNLPPAFHWTVTDCPETADHVPSDPPSDALSAGSLSSPKGNNAVCERVEPSSTQCSVVLDCDALLKAVWL